MIDALAIAKAVSASKAPAGESATPQTGREPFLQSLYAAFAPLAGLGQFQAQDRGPKLIVGGKRGEVEVSRTASWVDVGVRELVSFSVDRSRFGESTEIRYKKGLAVIMHFMCGGEGDIYTVRDNAGAPRQFSQLDDAVEYVAKAIGACLTE